MSLQYLMKDQAWTPAKSKTVSLPTFEISVNYDDVSFGTITSENRASFEAELEKIFKAKSVDPISRAESLIRAGAQKADAEIPTLAEDPAKSCVESFNKNIIKICQDLGISLKKNAADRISEAYKTVFKKPMTVKVMTSANVAIDGTATLSGDAATGLANAASAKEVAAKMLTGLVYPSQDLAEGIVGDSKAAAPHLNKAIKDCNVLSKTMREAAKKSTPQLEALLKSTPDSLDKSLTLIEKFLSNSQSRTRQLKAKITAVESQAKELKNKDVTTSANEVLKEATELLNLLNGFANISPLIDLLAKPLSLKSPPDFPKYITTLNRLNDPRPSHDLELHLQRLGDFVAEVAKE